MIIITFITPRVNIFLSLITMFSELDRLTEALLCIDIKVLTKQARCIKYKYVEINRTNSLSKTDKV